MHKFFIVVFLLFAPVSIIHAQNQDGQSGNQHPNIIFIFVDDMGYGDLSSFGNKVGNPKH